MPHSPELCHGPQVIACEWNSRGACYSVGSELTLVILQIIPVNVPPPPRLSLQCEKWEMGATHVSPTPRQCGCGERWVWSTTPLLITITSVIFWSLVCVGGWVGGWGEWVVWVYVVCVGQTH